MSDLLNQASLVMVPSGYKEDTVYSVVPSDGSGDLSFTRASNGTRINSAGLVEVCPWNLVKYSEDFSSSDWSKGNLTITTDSTTAPNGTTTADKAIPNTTNGAHGLENTGYLDLTIGQTYTASFYAKASGYNFIQFLADGGDISGNPRANFNLSNGTLGSVDTGLTASIESVGNSWYKCTVSFVVAYNTFNMGLYVSDSSTASRPPVFTGNGTDGVFIWGAQLNIGSTAKPYFPTTDRLNVPRLTYQNGGGGCPSLLLEKQSTNNFSYSEQLDNGFWTPLQITITANNTTSPDGTQNAEKITEDAISGVHLFYNTSSVTSASTSTASIFYKKGTRRYFSIKLQIGSNSYTQVFDADGLTTGSNSSNGLTSVSTSIVSMGNGWVRASVTGTDPAAGTANYMICSLSNSATPTFDSGNFNPSYLGSSSEYGFFYGAQLEASSYPTSYIPSTSSSATRVADECSKTGISSLFGTNQGTFFIDFLYLNSVTVDYLFDVTDSINYERFLMYSPTGNDIYTFYDSQNSGFATYQLTKGQRYKIGVKYNSSGTVWYVNGVLSATGTVSFAYQMAQIYLGQRYSLVQQTQMQVNQSIVFPTALTNAELASLTTI